MSKQEKPPSVENPKKIKCGLIMPISALDGYSAEHWIEVKSIIIEALDGIDCQIDLVSSANEVAVIQSSIIKNIYDSDIVICDVSGKNPNVMFELGMRLAFNKIAVIIKDDITDYSFDTSPLEHLGYQSDLHYPSIMKFKELLRRKVLATLEAYQKNEYKSFLDNFTNFKLSTVAQEELGPTEFILKSLEDLKQSINAIQNRDSLHTFTIEELRNNKHLPRSSSFNKLSKPTISSFELESLIASYCFRNKLKRLDLTHKEYYESALQSVASDLSNIYALNELEALDLVNAYFEKNIGSI